MEKRSLRTKLQVFQSPEICAESRKQSLWGKEGLQVRGSQEPSVADGAWLMEEVMVTKSAVRCAKVQDPPPDWRWKGVESFPRTVV